MNVKIFYGVPFYTMDSERTVKRAVVSIDGKVEFLTENPNEAHNLYPEAEVIRFSEGCVIPGFIDSHVNLRSYSILFKDFDLFFAGDRSEVIEMLEGVSARKKEGEWVYSGGLKKTLLTDLTKEDLDAVTDGHPAVLFSQDLSAAIANSKALELSGIDATRSDPYGGVIGRGPDNRLNGILFERAIELVKRHMPEERSKSVDSAIEKGLSRLVSYGITTICDCSISPGTGSLRSLMKLQRRDKLKIRVETMVDEHEALKLGEIGVPSGFGNEKLRIGGVMLIVDGTLASLTGYMSKPYVGRSGNGLLLMSDGELYTLLRNHYSNYVWVALSCVGDKANEIALKIFSRISSERGIPRGLKRIEFAQALKDEDIEKFTEMGVIAVMVPAQIPTDRVNAIKYLGPDAGNLFRCRSILSSGAPVAFASNTPYAPVNPLYGLYCAVERKGFDDGPEMRFYPRERVLIDDAVYAYTMGGAHACGMESEVGSLEQGKYTDFVHLSHDPMRSDTDRLQHTEVLDVFVGAEAVYQSERESSE